MKKILILGGGFGGISVYQKLHRLVHPVNVHNLQIELISKTNYFTFTPMLHEVATGAVNREHIIHPLREILHCCGKDFHQATVKKIDPKKKIVVTDQGDHGYDVLIVALGAEQSFFNTPGADQYALALKWLPGALAIRNRIIASFERASEMHDMNDKKEMDKFLHFVIVGGGATGTEFAGQVSDLLRDEMKDYYKDIPNSHAKITFVHAGSRLLEQLSPRASKLALARLRSMGVNVLLNTQVDRVKKDGVQLSSGSFISSNSVFWTAGTQSVLLGMLPKKMLTERGQLSVLPTFQTPEYPSIFGIGDNAHVLDAGYAYPPLAQAATQASNTVAYNVVAYLRDKKLKKKPYFHKGSIVPIGNHFAILEKKPVLIAGFFMWIVRRAVFITEIPGLGNKLHVIFDWIVDLFMPRDTSQI